MTEVHCTGHVDYNPKKTTDFGYELVIDNDGEIQIIDRAEILRVISVPDGMKLEYTVDSYGDVVEFTFSFEEKTNAS